MFHGFVLTSAHQGIAALVKIPAKGPCALNASGAQQRLDSKPSLVLDDMYDEESEQATRVWVGNDAGTPEAAIAKGSGYGQEPHYPQAFIIQDGSAAAVDALLHNEQLGPC